MFVGSRGANTPFSRLGEDETHESGASAAQNVSELRESNLDVPAAGRCHPLAAAGGRDNKKGITRGTPRVRLARSQRDAPTTAHTWCGREPALSTVTRLEGERARSIWRRQKKRTDAETMVNSRRAGAPAAVLTAARHQLEAPGQVQIVKFSFVVGVIRRCNQRMVVDGTHWVSPVMHHCLSSYSTRFLKHESVGHEQ